MMTETKSYKVWIDQDLCTGDGLCVEILPPVFTLLDDGLAYVKDEAGTYDGSTPELPKGAKGLASVAIEQYDDAFDASTECPGECIFIEDSSGNNVGPYAPQ